jgi:succinate dehydrogenase / fumarate reductase iron-sulfur subunit
MERQVTFKVFRYKQGQAASRYDTFTVTVDEDTTVLVALEDIQHDLDPSLTLRHSCHHASCGTCGMKINGREALACVVKVLDLNTETVVVEPLQNAPVISDLVVDMNPFYAQYGTLERPLLRHSEFLPEAEPPDGVETYRRFENCIECGACVSACPIRGSDPSYRGPAALAAARRLAEEPRGKDPQMALNWADDERGCWRCHAAFECTEACPSDVDPGGKIMALRRELTGQKFRRLFGFGRS